MARSLVIVESPAKARTINRYLGKDYVVKSSVGHVRDLPVGGKQTDSRERAREAARTRKLSPAKKEEHKRRRARAQLVRRMGVDPDNGWEAEYEVLPGKDKVVSELKRLADRSEHVYLATDLDREGEAIAWHLKELIGGDPERFRRVVFNEITKPAIEAAFEDPGRIDENRVNAQQARRFLDRVVGFELSPLLWAKIARGLSAGRVQSVAVRLIVERERETRAFVPEEYWDGFADLARAGAAGEEETHRFAVARDGGAVFRPGNAEAAEAALARLRAAQFVVGGGEDRPTTTAPGAPFITSTLQQAASTRLGFAVRKTMSLAQRLYEAGHITYMRTDSTNLSRPAVAAVREYIEEAHGKDYLSPRPAVYASKAAAQEAHEAIRPTNVRALPDGLSASGADERRLYGLIWRQFVACQMARARYLSTTVVAEGNGFELRARGRILQFDGYTRVLAPAAGRDEDRPIPAFAEGQRLRLVDSGVDQEFNKPPPRYGEASLVRELEKLGIGRPSTYAAIISTIQERGYVSLEKRRFRAERIGELVTDRLVENFSDLMDYSFTAELEGELDRIAGGERGWRSVLDGFYGGFSDRLSKAGAARGGMRANEPTDTDVPCSRCGRPMQVRTASTGVFLGCSGYRLPPKERCTNTQNLTPGDEAVDVEEDGERELELLRSKRRCPKCGTPMDSYLIDATRKLHVCGNNPDCGGFEVEQGEFRIKGYDGPTLTCERCGAEMQLKSGRFGKYFGCTNDECGNTRKILRDGRPAPPRADPVPMPELACERVDDHFVLRDGAAGLFLAASQFPRNRETRAPLVRELKAHANELDPRFAYLLDAPEADPDGNPAALKWSRKTREQFVASDRDGKPTAWRAHYRDGRWQVETGSTRARKGGRRAASKSGPRRRNR
ncbi:MAG: type I DNA topoisomerase [Gammaproteobacteria bacterium]|nr:type I DNA topoisomerase [Gammaproteobacteria bacterium]